MDTYYGYERSIDSAYPWVEYTWTYNGERWTGVKTCVAEKTKEETAELPTDPVAGDVYVQYKENYIWTPATGANDLYQIPVIKSPQLPYGPYTVVITPTYIPFFDHTGNGGYDFYLDAVRVYSPAEGMEDYYLQDGEAWPQYVELRKQLLTTDESGNATGYVNGISFIDGVQDGKITDYEEYGPNNEIYLNSNQAVAFAIDSKGQQIAGVHVGMKIFDGAGTLSVSCLDAEGNSLSEQNISSNSHTDLYYNISSAYLPVADSDVSNVIVLTNTGNKPITLTTLKITYGEAPSEEAMLVMDLQKMQAAGQYVSRKTAPAVETGSRDNALVFSRHSLSLQSSIAMHYYVEDSVLAGYDRWYVCFERYDYQTDAVVTQSVEATPYGNGQLFAYALSSYQMGDPVTATLYGVRDGEIYQGQSITGSVAQFIQARLPETDDEAMLRLYANLLTYGARAQSYFGYRTEELADAVLGDYAAYVTNSEPAVGDISSVSTRGFSGAVGEKVALGIASQIQLQMKIRLDGYEAESVYGVIRFERNGETVVQRVEGRDFVSLGDSYVMIFDCFTAADGRRPVEITVFNAEGEAISETWTYSIASYYSTCNSGVAGAVMKALLNYLDAAEAVFGTK